MSDTKKPWYSKTVILGVLQLAAGLTGVLVGSEFVQQYPRVLAGAVAVAGGIAIALRFVTDLPIEW